MSDESNDSEPMSEERQQAIRAFAVAYKGIYSPEPKQVSDSESKQMSDDSESTNSEDDNSVRRCEDCNYYSVDTLTDVFVKLKDYKRECKCPNCEYTFDECRTQTCKLMDEILLIADQYKNHDKCNTLNMPCDVLVKKVMKTVRAYLKDKQENMDIGLDYKDYYESTDDEEEEMIVEKDDK